MGLHMKESYFKIAREESLLSDYTGCGSARVGCCVVYKNTILARGHNSNKTSPIQNRYNIYRYKNDKGAYLPPKVHSEIAALSKIRYLDIDFSLVQVYVYRELRSGEKAMSRPCPSCMAYLRDMGIKNVFYTTPEGYCHEKID